MKEKATVKVNCAAENGMIRRLNGGNLAPALTANRRRFRDITQPFGELKLPCTRLHDAPLENPNMRLVDVNNIFPLFHADPDDGRNYYFDQTDDYIENCLNCGTQIVYRLGVSIEHGKKRYFVAPPEDYEKWAKICIRIIEHFNEGRWHGHYWQIKYWEIWNEPANCDSDGLPKMWGGTTDEFNNFYCTVSKILKERFPHLMIGGPSHGLGNGEPGGPTEVFLKKCAAEKAPVDFYSWHCYSDSIEHYAKQVAPIRKMVDACGFPHAELHLNEWHYVPMDWSRSGDIAYHKFFYSADGFKGLDSAAFLCGVLTSWQDTPLDMGNYYTVTSSGYGIFTNLAEPTKSYFGLKAFGQMSADYPKRFKVKTAAPVYALGGSAPDGRKMLLISCFKLDAGKVTVTFEQEIRNVTVRLVDRDHDLAEIPASPPGKKLELAYTGTSAVFTVEFDC